MPDLRFRRHRRGDAPDSWAVNPSAGIGNLRVGQSLSPPTDCSPRSPSTAESQDFVVFQGQLWRAPQNSGQLQPEQFYFQWVCRPGFHAVRLGYFIRTLKQSSEP